jgi:hypothetical protein
VTFNVRETKEQRRAWRNWKKLRRDMVDDPGKALWRLRHMGDDVKVPIFIQGAIHGNEYEGVDANFQIYEKLATTPYGTDPLIDDIFDHGILLFNVIQNPDGRIAGTRANGNGFDLNRDFLTQSQPEVKASVSIMQKWLPVEMLDQHGYVTPTLIEATTKPHNPSIEYDLWLKWNQARIDFNEAAMNARGFAVTRPINDWCSNGNPAPASGICPDGNPPGPAVAEGWDDWGPFYTPMYAQHVGLDGSTVEMCNSTGTACGVPGGTAHERGRLGSRIAQETVAWSTTEYVLDNRTEMLHDMLVRNLRGKLNAPRPECCDPPFDVANNWMTEHPKAFVIPLGDGQRSDPEANRLVRWLLFNGIEVEELDKKTKFDGEWFEKGSYVVWMTQSFRGLASTALGLGSDISETITRLYAPPASWSHGYLWGADVVTIPRDAHFSAKTSEIRRPSRLDGGVDRMNHKKKPAMRTYVLGIDSPTAVRVLNDLVADGLSTQIAMAEFTSGGETFPAGSAVFTVDSHGEDDLDDAGEDNGLTFHEVSASSLPALDPVDRAPRIAVLTGAVNQDVWSLRELGFQADPVSTGTINSALDDPLANYDVIFNSGSGYPANTPANATGRARLAAFFANGGGYIGAGTNGASFLVNGAQVAGLTTGVRGGGLGHSGIVNWINVGGANSPIVGTYPANDTLIVDPPTWYTGVPATMTVDGKFPASGILASGFWLTSDAQSVTAPNSPIILHGMNTGGTSRLATYANNPLYRADPEREWPSLGAAIYWTDQ